MLIKLPKASDCHESDVTPESSISPVAVCSVARLPVWRPVACRVGRVRLTLRVMLMSSPARRLAGSPKSFQVRNGRQ